MMNASCACLSERAQSISLNKASLPAAYSMPDVFIHEDVKEQREELYCFGDRSPVFRDPVLPAITAPRTCSAVCDVNL